MLTIKRAFLAGAMILGLALPAGGAVLAGHEFGWGVRDYPLAERADRLSPFIDIDLPDGAGGPVPAVLLLHGCGGQRDIQAEYSAAIVSAGYAAVRIDSLAARGIGRTGALTQVCTGMRLWGQERSVDIYAAIEHVRRQPEIDSSRLVLVGWSHGGWTILEALSFAGEAQRPPGLSGDPPSLGDNVRAAILIYPYCSFPAHADGTTLVPGIPVRSILADQDMIAPKKDCERLFERARTSGHDLDYEVWPDVTHAFDDQANELDPRMRYDEDATMRARSHVVDLLDQMFGATG